jgi:serine/threonine-protein kinase HipA
MQALVARVEPAIARVQMLLPAGFPERTAQTIFDGLRRQSRAWEAGLPGLA